MEEHVCEADVGASGETGEEFLRRGDSTLPLTELDHHVRSFGTDRVDRLRVLRPLPELEGELGVGHRTIAVAARKPEQGAAGVTLRRQVVRSTLLDLAQKRIDPRRRLLPVAELVLPLATTPRNQREKPFCPNSSASRPACRQPSTATTSSPRDSRRAAKLPIPRHISNIAFADRAMSTPSWISARPPASPSAPRAAPMLISAAALISSRPSSVAIANASSPTRIASFWRDDEHQEPRGRRRHAGFRRRRPTVGEELPRPAEVLIAAPGLPGEPVLLAKRGLRLRGSLDVADREQLLHRTLEHGRVGRAALVERPAEP